MKEIFVSPEKLKIIIDNGKLIGEGFYGSVFTFNDELIKLDKELYHLLKNHNIKDSEKYVYYYYHEKYDFEDIEQLEILEKKQKSVKLTKFPTGVVRINNVNDKVLGVIAGTTIPYFKDYSNLDKLDKKDYKRALIVLKKLLYACRELEENEIAQEDLYHITKNGSTTYNVLYRDTDVQMIDTSGPNIFCEKKYRNAKGMYIELGQIINDFYEYNHLVSPIPRWHADTFLKNKEMVKELYYQTKGL